MFILLTAMTISCSGVRNRERKKERTIDKENERDKDRKIVG